MPSVEGYDFPADRWYEPREHLWLRPEPVGAGPDAGTVVTVGVDALGQELLGEVVYVELVEAGAEVRRGDALGSLEAEKMVRPVLAPVSGRVVEVNGAVAARPRLLNTAPYGEGWLFRVRAARWTEESADLVHGAAAILDWARAEVEASRR